MNAPQKPGWLARLLLTLAMIGVVVVGFFFLTAALIAGAVLALVVGVRLWWTLRKLKRAGVDPFAHPASSQGNREDGGALDGEYQVVERESASHKLPPSSSSSSSSNIPPAP